MLGDREHGEFMQSEFDVMNRPSAAVLVLALLGSPVAGAAAQAGGDHPLPTYSLEAAAINGQPLPEGPVSRIEVLPGDVITAEVYVRDWSVFGEGLVGAQAQIDTESYDSGERGTVAPVDFREKYDAGEENRENFFIDTAHPSYIHRRMEVLPLTDTRSPEGFRWLSVLIRPPGPVAEQDGKKFYVGTVRLEASDDAAGTFDIGLVLERQGTVLIEDTGASIEPILKESLVIEVLPPASPGSVQAAIAQLNEPAASRDVPASVADLIARRNLTIHHLTLRAQEPVTED